MNNIQIQTGKNVIIRNPTGGLVLDASEYLVKIQNYNKGVAAQMWQLEEFSPGKYYIVNQANGKILDIENGAVSENNIITYPNYGTENQQWSFHSNGTIVSLGGNLVVDILKGQLNAGNKVIAYPNNGTFNQIFEIEYV